MSSILLLLLLFYFDRLSTPFSFFLPHGGVVSGWWYRCGLHCCNAILHPPSPSPPPPPPALNLVSPSFIFPFFFLLFFPYHKLSLTSSSFSIPNASPVSPTTSSVPKFPSCSSVFFFSSSPPSLNLSSVFSFPFHSCYSTVLSYYFSSYIYITISLLFCHTQHSSSILFPSSIPFPLFFPSSLP